MKNSLRLGLLSLATLLAPAAYAHDVAAQLAAKIAALNLNPRNTAVLIVDIQKDFVEGGSLAVANTGPDYIKAAQTTTDALKEKGYKIYASQDYHPANHMSFVSNNPGSQAFTVVKKMITKADGTQVEIDQVMWPAHCVQGTPGADNLINGIDDNTQKGTNPDVDSYSALYDGGNHPTGLSAKLQHDGIENLITFGIATDVCVNATVQDALGDGFKVYLLETLCRGVFPEASANAVESMRANGATIITACSCSHK